MLQEELQEQIKLLEPNITTIKSYWKKSNKEETFNKLTKTTNEELFWQNPNHATISKQLHDIQKERNQYLYIIETSKELPELLSLFSEDKDELAKIAIEIERLKKTISLFKVKLLLNKENDQSNCFLYINAGAGGTESQDWAEMLMRMYIRFCEKQKLQTSIVDYQPGEEAGIKSATLFIKGKNAYGYLKSEHGTHRLVRISPFDSNKRRHTSFAGALIIPEHKTEEITIDAKDLRIDTYRASGAGGQHVNKTESAVRITHIPTNIVVQCQNERSQLQNKETAMKMLKSKLVQKQKEEQKQKESSLEKKKIEWGSQIRSYVLHPYKMIKDHRTNIESKQPELILDGDLMAFIEGYLIFQSEASA